MRRKDFHLDPAHRQDPAPESNFSRHTDMAADNPAAEQNCANCALIQGNDGDGQEPTLESVARTMFDAGFRGDLYPPLSAWEMAPTACFASYPYPDSLDEMRRGGRGTGLGLYLCQELCELNRATLIYLDRPGGGSVLGLDLEVARAALEQRDVARGKPYEVGRLASARWPRPH